jgi:hypothetical protein
MVDSIFKTSHDAFATQKVTLAGAPKFDAAPSQKLTHAANVAHHNFINDEFLKHFAAETALRHEKGQLAHNVEALKVVAEYHACEARNDKVTAQTDATTSPAFENCIEACSTFNSETTTFNTNNGFSGDMAYSLAVCEIA